MKREGTPSSRVPAGQFLTGRFTSLKETLLNIYKSFDPATFRFSFLPFNQVKGNFVLILALASNNLSVYVVCVVCVVCVMQQVCSSNSKI